MPIDYGRYPDNWLTEIRPAILKRANHRCEWCGVANGAPLHRFPGDRQRVVLTIAHVYDPNPHNCDPANLAALCQRCHLAHDREHHLRRAAETRRRKRVEAGQMVLLETME